jgi:2-hydroxychromene-2-carboxylate isomerase
MANVIEFHFDVVSPASYLAWTQLPKLAEETGAQIDHRPFFLPGLFKEAGSSSPISIPAKGKWLFVDLNRFARKYGVPFGFNNKFPMNSITMMRGLLAYRDTPQFDALTGAFFDAVWVSNKDVTDAAVIAGMVAEAGVDPDEFSAKVSDPELKQKLVDVTSDLAKRGAFGAPTFFVADEMFWGQDRLDFVREAALAA